LLFNLLLVAGDFGSFIDNNFSFENDFNINGLA
jgi:hypothetical protein